MGAAASADAAAEEKVSSLISLSPDEFDDLARAVGSNEEASHIFKEVLERMDPDVVAERLGYVKEEELKKAHHAALPPELQNFEVLGKDEAVQAVITDDAFKKATAAV